MKLIQALPDIPNKVTENEVNEFLESKLNLQLATIDERGYPIIQPLWFLFDKGTAKIYVATQKMTRKARNLYENPVRIYFSIDDENFPHKGVKGRAAIRISEDIDWNIPKVEKLSMKYLGTTNYPLAQMIIENTKKGIRL